MTHITHSLNAYDELVNRFTSNYYPALLGAPQNKKTAFDFLAKQPWAIQPDMLETIISIANRDNESIEAVEAKLGRPLQNTRAVTMRGDVAIIPVVGPIFRYANLFTEISGATSLAELAIDFNRAAEDPAVNTIILSLDSPGGMAAGISEFADQIKNSSKKVIAYVDNMAASAAYWIASAASEIVISKTAMVGSVGAVVGIDTRKDLNTVEIVSSQSPKKRPDVTTDEGRKQIQERIDALAQVFIDDVANNRSVSVETVLADFGQGDLRLGEEAVKLGMADRVSTLETVIAGLAGNSNKGAAYMAANTNGAPAAETPAITREFLTANHPDIVQAILDEGIAQGMAQGTENGEKAGADKERARIQSVFAQSLPGHEKLINTLAFDGETTGEQAAVKILAVEKQARGNHLRSAQEELKPVDEPAAPDGEASEDKNLPVDERCKTKWNASQSLRDEFGNDFDSYLAYSKATEKGRVKVLGNKGA